MIKFLKDVKSEDLKGKKVIVRVDFNVPVQNGKVVNSYRIDRALPTIQYLLDAQAQIILISHIETKDVDVPTLRPAYEFLKENKSDWNIGFLEDYFDENAADFYKNMNDGDIVLLENVRKYEGEKKNDDEFSQKIAALGDMYVNDAFAVSHRSHASVVGIPKFLPGFVGLLLADEIQHLKIDNQTPHPFVFILGGAKFETKLPIISKFGSIADNIFVGGALINDVLKAKGFEVGKSLVSSVEIDLSKVVNNPRLIIPVDVVCQNDSLVTTKKISEVNRDDVIADIGMETIQSLESVIKNAKYILWNGPLGNFEKGFKDATIALAKMIGESEAVSVVGGGDTLASIQELGLEDKFSFISTGGGAMLQYLLDETLPGIQALENNI